MHALLAPGQVIELLVGRALHLCLDVLVAGDGCVALVQRLCGDFTSVIDAHQAGGMRFLASIELGIDDVRGRICAGGAACRRAQPCAGRCWRLREFVERRELSFFMLRIIAMRVASTVYSAAIFAASRTLKEISHETSHVSLPAALLAPIVPDGTGSEEESPWSGKRTLGYLATSGNTENSTLNTGFEVGYTTGKWVHFSTAAAIQPRRTRYDGRGL